MTASMASRPESGYPSPQYVQSVLGVRSQAVSVSVTQKADNKIILMYVSSFLTIQ